ncbi:44346_t:CDS:2, partial [Gigaspora margarita]
NARNFSLIETLKKYSDYLNSTAISMNELHYGNESVSSPENNSTMYQKPFYEHIDIQNYLPSDAIDRYRFMKELQLSFPIGVYRYYQSNYLGTINYVWRISEAEISNGRQEETSKA